MTRTALPYAAPDLSALARLLERTLADHLATHGRLPGHVEMMNLLARGAGKRNLQELKAAAERTAPTAPPIANVTSTSIAAGSSTAATPLVAVAGRRGAGAAARAASQAAAAGAVACRPGAGVSAHGVAPKDARTGARNPAGGDRIVSVPIPPSAIAGLRVRELDASDEALLQRFFDANPLYFEIVQGEPAWPDAAHRELHEPMPPGMSFDRKWIVGWLDDGGDLAAVANVVSDLIAPGVWLLGLFVVESARHGTGDAQALYRGIEDWARSNGAQWMRLGVVEGNERAERFWTRQGYVQTRTREGMPTGRTTRTVRVKVKPLAGGSVETYLGLVARDRPGSLLP